MYIRAMARAIPPDRLDRLVDCATRVFIEQGYARTQMADVAAALGVAKGTLYLCVESKEALFDLVVRYADGPRPIPAPGALPLRTPQAGATIDFIRRRLTEHHALPRLEAALSRSRVTAPAAELAAIVREIYRTVAAQRCGIELLDRSD